MNPRTRYLVAITILAALGYPFFLFVVGLSYFHALVMTLCAWLLALPGVTFEPAEDENCEGDYIIIEKKEQLENYD
mgnify:CR=1 FL=1